MSQYPLLATKLHIPSLRANVVRRPSLIERLQEGLRLGHRLTLLSAPAGYGKTTLLSEWAQAIGQATPRMAVAWLSLDEDDDDLGRFLAYTVAALRTLTLSQVEGETNEPEAAMGEGVLGALPAPNPPPTEALLTSLINEMSTIPDRVILILDDYHLVEAQPIHAALTFLLEHLPPQTHLVIASRDDPRLPLARLRARGQLTELRAKDLRFSPREAAQFLNQVMGLDLSAENVAALERRTEGWIAGLQLAALSMQGQKDVSRLVKSFTGSHRFVLDYLIEEVLERQSAAVQTFLLQTSVLNRLTGSLCDAVRFGDAKSPTSSAEHAMRVGLAQTSSSSSGTAVTGPGNGQAMLEALDRASLFVVPLDEEREWYRYHTLFAQLLRQRLRLSWPEQVPKLHRRASEWYEQNGLTEDAIEHALRAEEPERAADLIEVHVDATWRSGEHGKLRRWLSRLPVELVFSRPQLCVYHAWYLLARGQQDEAERSLRVAEQALEPSTEGAADTSRLNHEGQMSDTDRMRLRGRSAAMRAFVETYRGDVQGIIRHASQALEYLPEGDTSWRCLARIALGDASRFTGDMDSAHRAGQMALETCEGAGHIYCVMLGNLKVATTLREQGQLRRAIEICRQQMQLGNADGLAQGAVVGWSLAMWGEALAELNDLERAEYQAKEGVELAESGGDLTILGRSFLCLLRVLFSRRDMAGAEQIVKRMEDIAREHRVPPWITQQIAAWQARLWLEEGNLDAASQWVRERGLNADAESETQQDMGAFLLFDYIVMARILIAEGRLDEAAELLERLLEMAEAGGHTSRVIEILMLKALALQAGGDTAHAMTPLEQALTVAEPGGFIRAFVDEGPPMARLLYEAAIRGIAPDYTRRLLAAFPVAEPQSIASPGTQVPKPELVEPLSERELEVLQLIAEGLTNQEVGSRLFISLNTVKAHARNIYGKLNVHSRTQAVARARGLGLLQLR